MVSGPWGIAFGCSCIPNKLEQQYELADNVLIAEITGCAPDAYFRHGNCGDHGWIFKTVEDLKGSNAKVRRLPSEINSIVGTSCDVTLDIGKKYLLFLYEGRAYQCGGTRSYETAMSEVEVLRAYRDKKTAKITNPWYFDDRFGSCSLSHELDEATVQFEYRYAMPDGAALPSGTNFPAKPTPVMLLEPNEGIELSGQTLIEIGKHKVSLLRKNALGPDRKPYPVDLLGGDPVLALLDKLSDAKEVVVSGMRSVPDRAPEPFRMMTSAPQGTSGIGRFKACVAAHPDFENERSPRDE
jgi:hypothetical protein